MNIENKKKPWILFEVKYLRRQSCKRAFYK